MSNRLVPPTIDPSLSAIPDTVRVNFARHSEGIQNNYDVFGQTQYAPHVRKSHQQIMATARTALARAPQDTPSRALVLGAGGCHDVPLPDLVASFDHTTLVDLDPDYTAKAVNKLPEDLASKVRIVGADLSGVLGDFATKVQASARNATDYDSFAAKLLPHMRNIQPSAPTLPDQPYTFVSSHLLMSQIIIGPHYIVQEEIQAGDIFMDLATDPNDPLTQEMKGLETRLGAAHIEHLGRLVLPHGTVHFADTLATVRYGKYITHRNPLVDAEALQSNLDQHFDPIAPTKQWVWRSMPPLSGFVVTSYALEPRAS